MNSWKLHIVHFILLIPILGISSYVEPFQKNLIWTGFAFYLVLFLVITSIYGKIQKANKYAQLIIIISSLYILYSIFIFLNLRLRPSYWLGFIVCFNLLFYIGKNRMEYILSNKRNLTNVINLEKMTYQSGVSFTGKNSKNLGVVLAALGSVIGSSITVKSYGVYFFVLNLNLVVFILILSNYSVIIKILIKFEKELGKEFALLPLRQGSNKQD